MYHKYTNLYGIILNTLKVLKMRYNDIQLHFQNYVIHRKVGISTFRRKHWYGTMDLRTSFSSSKRDVCRCSFTPNEERRQNNR